MPNMFSLYTDNGCERAYQTPLPGIGGGVFSVCDNTISGAAILAVINLDAVD